MTMTDGTDETEHFEGDDAVAGAGYRLVASWGPRRWRLGGSRPSSSFVREVAYAPDGETLFFAVGNVVVELDRQGRPAHAPLVVSGENVLITIAENGRRAAILRAGTLSVVELPSMWEIVRLEARPSLYGAVISGDGEVVTTGGQVWRVADGEPIAELEGRLACLSYDGSMSLSVRQGRGMHVFDVDLSAIGASAAIRTETTYDGFPWAAAWSRDGSHVAWTRRRDGVVWRTKEPLSRAVFGRDVLGPITFVGDRLLASAEGGLALFALDGTRVRSVADRTPTWVLAISPSGDRALVGTGEGPRELDLASGAWLEGTPGTTARVTQASWDPAGQSACVLQSDGELRLWDVAAWRTERVLDRDRSRIARTGAIAGNPAWAFGVERVRTLFARDGEHVVVCDAAGTVTMLTREGEAIWQRAIEIDPARGGGWEWRGATFTDEGDAIDVYAAWSRTAGHDPDGTPRIDDEHVVVRLDARDGHVVSREELRPSQASAPAKIHVVLHGADGYARVGAERLPIPMLMGQATGVFPSDDEETLLVATSAGLLLRYDRVRGSDG